MQELLYNMKDFKQIFKQKFETIMHVVGEGKYDNAEYIAKDLIRVGYTLDLKDEVFLCETMESTFDQINRIFDEYIVPKSDAEKLKQELKKYLSEFIRGYATNDLKIIYKSLSEIRYAGTSFQLNAWHRYSKSRPEGMFLRGRVG